MEKIKAAIITVFFGFSLYQLINGSVLSSVVTLITAVMLFLVLYSGWDYFGESASILGMVVLIISSIDIVGSSKAFDINGIAKNNKLFIQSIEGRYCPVRNQPDEIKRESFNKMSDKLFELCLFQNHRNITALTFDLSKTVYLDPVLGTVDSFYNEFFSKKDTPLTCLELAQKMDRLCPGLLEL
ncbi:hypothetical protein [Aeromonas enterica]